jgi:CubicO group peptidase (beta-lactamase class C family)
MLVFLQALIDPSTAPSDLQGPLETVQQPAAILDDQSGTGTTSVSLGWFLTRGGGKSNGMLSKNGGTNGFVSWIGFVPSKNKGLFGVVSRNKNAMWTQGAKYLRGELSSDRL